jgi:penicillin G amidase
MKIFSKIMWVVASILVLATIIGIFVIRDISKRAVTSYDGRVEIPGLNSTVTILRDSLGKPSIYASNNHDLYLATGYIMAQDRLWQMDLLRRVTQGRLSEIFGEKLLDTDLLMRSLRIEEKSHQVFATSDTTMQQVLEAFAQGVNEFMSTRRKKLPPEFAILGYKPEPWEPVHSLNLIGYIAWDLNGAWTSEVILHKLIAVVGKERVNELVPNLGLQTTNTFATQDSSEQENELDKRIAQDMGQLLTASRKIEELGLGVFQASNNWAVSGERSETGKPLLANDMHLNLFAPGIWYQIHQVIEGQLNVTGVAFPGQPLVVGGHNDHIAWGMTNVMIDDIDFYLETTPPGDSTRYLLDGEWLPFRHTDEVIRVKGGKEIVKRIYFTHRGPVISGLKGVHDQVISMRWLGNEPSNEFRSIYLFNRAKNWDDFKEAAKTFIAVSQNIAYADTAGNIGLYCCAGIPIREGNPAWIFPGETSKHDWKGLVPFEALPHVYNPASGYVASANCRTADESYPYYISHWFDLPARMNRITQLLEATPQHSTASFSAIQTDQVSHLPGWYLPTILEALNRQSWEKPIYKNILSLLEQWDGSMGKESVASTVFENFYILFIEATCKEEMGEKLYKEFISDKILVRSLFHSLMHNPSSRWFHDQGTGEEQNLDSVIVHTFTTTIEKLTKELGPAPEDWTWGKVHKFALDHPLGSVGIINTVFKLNRGPFPVGGSAHTIAPFSYKYFAPFKSTHGASHRHIYDLSGWDRSLTVIPTGTSGIPSSPYYNNQTAMYLANQYHPDLSSREAVKKKAKHEMTLIPE